jgi:hypothetical protein
MYHIAARAAPAAFGSAAPSYSEEAHMGDLSSEFARYLTRSPDQPRVYADANVPAGLIEFMRRSLGWDVLFVLEHDDLRRAQDGAHYRMARRLHRTLLTLDRDYLDDRRFPPDASAGVLVVSAPDERALAGLLARVDRLLFRDGAGAPCTLPFEGRKLHLHGDWRRSSAGAAAAGPADDSPEGAPR